MGESWEVLAAMGVAWADKYRLLGEDWVMQKMRKEHRQVSYKILRFEDDFVMW